ncbi:hypothetical protein G6F68_015253 [Rhizopus microsporus]|nr:hypothetical protein G6F68_015253 [Rhizopus microsporus]
MFKSEIEQLRAQHAQAIQDLEETHSKVLEEAKSIATAKTRTEAERELRAEFESEIERLSASHHQAVEQLQVHHTSGLEQLQSELKLEIEKQAQMAIEHQEKLDKITAERDGQLEDVRKEMEEALKAMHQAELARLETEHGSMLNELKRYQGADRES